MTSKAAHVAAATTLCLFASIGILISVLFIAWIISILTGIGFPIVLGGEGLILISVTKLVYDAVKMEDLDIDWDDEDLDV
jgi:hypothetical protein